MTPYSLHRPRGVALFVVLIVLLLVSLLVVAGLRTTLLQERMSAGTRDRAMALQNADAALVRAQQQIQAAANAGEHHGMDCSGRAEAGAALCLHHPSIAGIGSNGRGWQAAQDLQDAALAAGTPGYAVQYLGRRESPLELGLGDDPNYGSASGPVEAEYYRVLARGSDPQAAPDRSVVVLQATVTRE